MLAIQQNGYEAVEFATIESLRTGIASSPFSACVIDEPDHPDVVRATEQAARQGGHPTQFVVLPSLGSRGLPFGGPVCDVLEPPQTAERLGRALFAAVGRSRLLADSRVSYKHPAPSPDGKTLAWFSDEGTPGNFHLFTAPVDASTAVSQPCAFDGGSRSFFPPM